MLRKSFIIFLGVSSLFGCKSASETGILMDEVTLTEYVNERAPYQASKTLHVDIQHTKLDLRFNWEKQWVIGTASIDLNPYYFSTQLVELDAKGMEIKSVSKATKGDPKELEYEYDGSNLIIDLGRPYKRTETANLIIEYIAKPNGLIDGKEVSPWEKGLFFINPLNTDAYKDRQIWTQGETESNSRWFPTIDAPNERMTTEIFLHVDSSMTTLSNGILEFSIMEDNGKRLDYWHMEQPHAPYLVMLTIGNFAKLEDEWEDRKSVV